MKPKPTNQHSKTAIEELERRQIAGYMRLGREQGWGDDPEVVHARLSTGRLPTHLLTVDKYIEMHGKLPPGVSREAMEAAIQQNAKLFDLDPPTRYEEPLLYSTLVHMSREIERVVEEYGWSLGPRPLFGTVPTGSVNAITVYLPSTDEHIVIFEHGLFLFAYQMARVAARAFPTVSVQGNTLEFVDEPNPTQALRNDADIYEHFQRILVAYLIEGTSRTVPSLPINPAKTWVAERLLRAFEVFLVAHEYSHVARKHNERDAQLREEQRQRWSWDSEYDADLDGLSFTSQVMPPIEMTYWGVDYFFTCADIIDRGLHELDPNIALTGPNSDHPPPHRRRERLKDSLRANAPAKAAEDAIELAETLQYFGESLFASAKPQLANLRQQGVRPSVIWRSEYV